jgi:hypothetical protein
MSFPSDRAMARQLPFARFVNSLYGVETARQDHLKQGRHDRE